MSKFAKKSCFVVEAAFERPSGEGWLSFEKTFDNQKAAMEAVDAAQAEPECYSVTLTTTSRWLLAR